MTVMTQTFETAPLRSSVAKVLPEWIDYNGHMNVAYYVLAIDHAMDEIFDRLGIGIELVKTRKMGPMTIVNQIHYLDELLEGQEFFCDLQLLDADHKRMHYFVRMHHVAKGTLAATYEGITMNVDLVARRSAEYPADVLANVEALKAAHAGLPHPPQVGAPIAIRRKG